MNFRIYRTFTWVSAIPDSEIRFGGRNPIKLKAHDELQYFDSLPDNHLGQCIGWTPVLVEEAEKPENPYDVEDRKESERMAKELLKGIPLLDKVPTVTGGLPPVDRSAQQLTDGSPVPEDRSHTQDRGDGQQKGYIVLTAEERAKGFVRPVRREYIHVGVGGHEIDPNDISKHGRTGNGCGVLTCMGRSIAETYARDPKFYNGTFCCGCGKHFPLNEFVWADTDELVGS